MPIHNSQGISLAVTIQGEGYPILCLHGHPGSADCLQVLTTSLAPHYRTITPDLRGYGHSQVRTPFVMADHLADLARLWEQYHIGRGIILGWSLGGILALEMALRYPDWVRGLILIATAARPRSNHPPITWQDHLFTGIAGLINGIVPGWPWNINTFGRRSLFRYLIRRHTPTTYQYLASAALPAFLRTSRPATRALSQALRQGYDRLEALQTLQCRCLVLAGACDRHITPDSSQATATALASSQWICYPDTAHLFPWEIPQQVQTDIHTWLQQHPDIAASGPAPTSNL